MKQTMKKTISLLTLNFLFALTSASADENLLAKDRERFLADEINTIDTFQNVVHSVVNVSNIRKITRRSFFDYSSAEVPAGQGSGFVWDTKGHIVTNFHVIQGGDSFLITFHQDPKQYAAKLVGAEPKQDIAVLKLEELPKQLRPVQMGDSQNLKVGQKAMAIGNPFGLDNTITSGIVSALDRKIEGIGEVTIHGMIQTDSAINPGNSGGPLLDSSGKVIGMNTMIFSRSGTSAGVGFAVPANSIGRIVPELIEHGKVTRPGLGIGILPDYHKPRFGVREGLVITFVDEKGPAGLAGLKGITQDARGRYYLGDIVVAIDGKKLQTYDDIYHVLNNYKIGDTVEVTYVREKKENKVKVKLQAL